MTYKSILSVWDGHDKSLPALNAAIDMTQANDGHLHVLCVGFNRLHPGMYFTEATTLVVNEDFQNAKIEASKRKESAKKLLKATSINWSCETAVTPLVGLSPIIKSAAWFSDVVILPQPYGRDNKDQSVATLEAALFEGNAPVLVYPLATASDIGKRIVIAWNESAESLTAVRAALPLLKAADVVDIAIVDPDLHDADHADPGMALSTLLARHGVTISVSVLPRSAPRVSDVLCRHAVDFGADLIVMGAYGHSRLRESILGGATRNMLEKIKIPVLMAH